MRISRVTGEGGGRGCALLISVAPTGRRRKVAAETPESLASLGAVPPSVLVGTNAPVDVVRVTDPAEPQALLTHLRTAAETPGPLLVYLAGRLTVDRKQRRPHLALAQTSPHTVRYTALPWDWLAVELRERRPGSTTVVADLVADKDAWERLDTRELVRGLPVWGAVSAPVRPDGGGASGYTRALAALLRGCETRPEMAVLHAAGQSGLGAAAILLEPDGVQAEPGAAPGAGAVPWGPDVPAPPQGPPGAGGGTLAGGLLPAGGPPARAPQPAGGPVLAGGPPVAGRPAGGPPAGGAPAGGAPVGGPPPGEPLSPMPRTMPPAFPAAAAPESAPAPAAPPPVPPRPPALPPEVEKAALGPDPLPAPSPAAAHGGLAITAPASLADAPAGMPAAPRDVPAPEPVPGSIPRRTPAPPVTPAAPPLLTPVPPPAPTGAHDDEDAERPAPAPVLNLVPPPAKALPELPAPTGDAPAPAPEREDAGEPGPAAAGTEEAGATAPDSEGAQSEAAAVGAEEPATAPDPAEPGSAADADAREPSDPASHPSPQAPSSPRDGAATAAPTGTGSPPRSAAAAAAPEADDATAAPGGTAAAPSQPDSVLPPQEPAAEAGTPAPAPEAGGGPQPAAAAAPRDPVSPPQEEPAAERPAPRAVPEPSGTSAPAAAQGPEAPSAPPAPPSEPAAPPRPSAPPPPAAPPTAGTAPVHPAHDPRGAIGQALRAKRFSEASALAAGWEQYALRSHGPHSMEMVHVVEAQAQIAYESGQFVRAAERWIVASQGRLAWHAPDHPDAVNAVNNAHHVWQRLSDVQAALSLGPQMIVLRTAVPGASGRALRAVHRRLEMLRTGAYSNAG